MSDIPITDAFNITSQRILESISGEQGLTREERERYQKDPVSFSREILGGDPWEIQGQIMQSVADNTRTTIRSCHGVGKTWTAAQILLWFSVSFVPSTVVTTAPTARQVKDILWREINSQYYKAKMPLGGRILTQQLIMSEREKWFATGFTTEEHDLDKFQGFHNDNILVIVDEAAGVPKAIYDAIEGLLSSGITVRLLLIGNPTNEGTEFGKSFKSSLYNKFHLSAFDSPNFSRFGITMDGIRDGSWKDKINEPLPRPYLTTPLWVYERFTEWGEESPLFQVRVLGDFPTEGDDSLIPLIWLERSDDIEEKSGIKVLGVDVARSGSDESVVALRDGNNVRILDVWTQRDTMQTVGGTKRYIDEFKPDVINIDTVGIGAGVVDRLREQGYEVNGVNVGSRADDSEQYFNLRSQLYWTLRDKLEKRALKIPDDSVLFNELTGFRYEFTSKGQLKLEPKEKTRERVGKSPDRSDAISLTMFEKNTGGIAISDNISEAYDTEPKSDLAEYVSKMHDVYNVFNLDYNKSECPKCGSSVGIVLSDENGMMVNDVNNAKHGKCLICSISWEVQ